MKIHEFQAKSLLHEFGIKVPKGGVVSQSSEVQACLKNLKSKKWAVKAQILAGSRGKAGGVKIVSSNDAVKKSVGELLGHRIITEQTGQAGKEVHQVLIEEAVEIEEEFYIALYLDRTKGQIAIMASKEGGTDLEKRAEANPDSFVQISIDPSIGHAPFMHRKICAQLGLKGDFSKRFGELLDRLYKIFIHKDCLLLEVNPLVLTSEKEFVAVDAKIEIDENALFRQEKLASVVDDRDQNPQELQAKQVGCSYVSLNGNIGCLVNGAGLAMATMDLIKHYGAEPANFLDVGGSASPESIEEAFSIIMKDSRVEGVLVNIFGGIMKCDYVAQGIVAAAQKVGIKIPIVVRLEGTNVTLGQKIFEQSGLNVIRVDSLDDAAKKVVDVVKKAKAEK